MALTLKAVNVELAKHGHKAQLANGGGYFCFWGGGAQDCAYRQGETITTSFVELTINQVVSRRFVKKQQMTWTLRGTHLLLQTGTKVLNNELEEVFRRWYPRFRTEAA